MDIEQTLPKKPRFGLVVALSCVALFLVLGLALIFLSAKHVAPRQSAPNPNARLYVSPTSAAALA